MNQELVRKIEAHISVEPLRMNMGTFGQKYTCVRPGSMVIPPCGTVSCIAGWAVLLTPKPNLDFDPLKSDLTEGQLETFYDLVERSLFEAPALLEITVGQAERLFFTANWPARFREAHRKAHTPAARVAVVKDVLEYALAHDGDLE